MRVKNVQPAKANYFFWAAYRHLIEIYVNCFSRIKDIIFDSKNKFSCDWKSSEDLKNRTSTICYAISQIVSLIVMYTFGTVLCSILFVLHGIVLLPATFVIFVIFMTLRIYDKLYLVFRRVFVACPMCKEKTNMPVYVCSCGRDHTKLYPGKYGMLKRTCLCGNKLPTMNINGRRFLSAKCPHCSHPIKGREATPVCIPIIGSRKAGKTSYIGAVMNEFVTSMSPITDKKIVFYDEENKTNISRLLRNYETGYRQDQTDKGNLLAFNFFLEDSKKSNDKLMYIYDIAGESFQAKDDLLTQKQYGYCHGFVFLIDPLTIMSVREKYKTTENFDTIKDMSAEVDINEVIDTFLLNLKRITNLSANELSKVPCAVVINKIDEFDLEQQLGQPAVEAYLKTSGNVLTDRGEIIDKLVRDYLLKNGLSNFMSQIDTQFKNNRYFTCSCQGHMEDGTDFKSVRVFDPMQWILSLNDRKLGKDLHEYINGTFKVKFPTKKFNYSGTAYCVLDEYTDGDDTYYLLTTKQGKLYSPKVQVLKRTKLRDSSFMNMIKHLPTHDYRFMSPSDFSADPAAKDIVKEKLNINMWKKKIAYVSAGING